MSYRLPAEWEPQSFIQLTWPNELTDWAPYLDSAYSCYIEIARQVLNFEDLLIVTPFPDEVRQQLTEAGILPAPAGRRVVIHPCPINDTWARDHGFITLLSDDATPAPLLCDFCFNGWGRKFAAFRDNLINSTLKNERWPRSLDYTNLRHIVLEGGSIESDGAGTILTTSSCLLAPFRNDYATKAEAEAMLRQTLGAKHILWLDHGNLTGDDTDGHIDTLARLCPDDTIVYVRCDDPRHPDYDSLQAMEEELHDLRTADGRPYRLLPLPMAPRTLDDNADFLPATYANFLIVNGGVLMPSYGLPERDQQAIEVLQQAFPGRRIVNVDCSVLVEQHGSLHCVTMQFPSQVPLMADQEEATA